MMTVRQALPATRTRWLSLAALVLATGLLVWFVFTREFPTWDFRNELWAPAYLLVRGASPYNIQVLFPDGLAVWLPPAIGLFAPLGWLSLADAVRIWLCLSVAAMAATVWLAAGSARPHPAGYVLSLTLALLFPATVAHLMLGQFSILATLLLLLAAYALGKGRSAVAGFCVALSLTKPQLAALALPGLLIGAYRQGGPRAVPGLLGWIAVWLLVLSAPLWLVYPAWPADFLLSVGRNQAWAHPSLAVLLPVHFGALGLALWLALAASSFAANAWLWARYPPARAVVWSLALTPLVVPYVWSWDFVLLAPLLVRTGFELHSRRARAVLLAGYLACYALLLWLQLAVTPDEFVRWWVPGFLLGVCILSRIAGTRALQRAADLAPAA
jgi:hypothetical protein